MTDENTQLRMLLNLALLILIVLLVLEFTVWAYAMYSKNTKLQRVFFRLMVMTASLIIIDLIGTMWWNYVIEQTKLRYPYGRGLF